MINKSLLLILFISLVIPSFSQHLKVTKEESTRVYRDLKKHNALIVFESAIEDLSIMPNPSDSVVEQIHNKHKLYLIETDTRVNREEYPYYVPNDRSFILKSPDSHEYSLDIENVQPKEVYFFTVVLPPYFPLSISAEYVFTQSSICGFRVACGRRFGAYIGYKWGNYKRSGINIDTFENDVDVSNAKCLGFIRQSITAGIRIGVNHKFIPVNLFIGGGYGEYGKQWENIYPIGNSIYFYSDYIKGFNGELGVSLILFKYLSLTTGIDCVFGNNGKISTDYMIGVGITIPENIFKLKRSK